MCDNCYPMVGTCGVCKDRSEFTCNSCLAFDEDNAIKPINELANPKDSMIDWLCKSCYASAWGNNYEDKI